MKQFNINKAYDALMRLSVHTFPIKKSYAIYKLINNLKLKYEFGIQEIHKIIAKYNGIPQQDGTVIFNGEYEEKVQKSNQCLKELNEINNFEVDMDFNFIPIHIEENETKNINITPVDIDSLRDFIIFDGLE